MPNDILIIENLHKRFGAVAANDGVELRMRAGETLAVIGPNGAGKSTLIAQVAGEIQPDAGRILFDGHDITRQPAYRRAHLGIARSYQITSIFPRFTAMENVTLALQARAGHSFRFWQEAAGAPELAEPAARLIEELGLTDRANLPAGTLAHGEQRQLELAIALATRPKLLILDEPTAGMAHEDARRMGEILQRLKGELSLLLVEHDMDTVFSLADRVCVLVYGKVIALGGPEAIRNDPEVRRAYLGEDEAGDAGAAHA